MLPTLETWAGCKSPARPIVPFVTQLETMLDLGEAEAIVLAVECAPSLLLIDERDDHQVRHTLGVPLTGTLGVLLRAKALGPFWRS